VVTRFVTHEIIGVRVKLILKSGPNLNNRSSNKVVILMKRSALPALRPEIIGVRVKLILKSGPNLNNRSSNKVVILMKRSALPALRPSHYGRLSLRITRRFRCQFASLKSAAQHLAL